MTASSVRLASSIALLTAVVGLLVLSLPFGESAPGRGDGSLRRHPMPPPFLVFRTLAPPEAHGRVALLGLERPRVERQLTDLSCLRLHYAGGRGLCVVQESEKNESTYVAYIFDRTFTRGRRIALDGVPIRVRVAPSGRHGAITTYFEDETPAGERLAIDSVVIDMASGRVLAHLHEFRIDSDGLPPPVAPIDVGSVAFESDGDRFFGSISTSSERYLVAGSIAERRMTTIRTGVASESLSPDGTQLLVKKLKDHGFWQLAVIDLHTWSERDLQQGQRSVDDQVEWLDNTQVLYHDVDESSTSLWVLSADGVTGPRLFVKDGYSGTVQR